MMLLNAESPKKFLSEEYARRKTFNSRYSQRAFARQLGLSAGELSEILNGKRRLSLKSALRIAKSLGLNTTETKYLVHLVQLDKTKSFGDNSAQLLEPEVTEISQRALREDLFYLVSAWHCFAIINLTECEGFRWDVSWIAKRLNISRVEVESALMRLERVGVIQKIGRQRQITNEYVLSSSGIPSESIRNYHRQILQKAIDALEFQSVEERDISGIGFALDPKNLPSIKKDISEFQDQLVAKYSSGKKSEVYQFECALFKLTSSESFDYESH